MADKTQKAWQDATQRRSARIGDVYGRLTVIDLLGRVPVGKQGQRATIVECRCECGKTCTVKSGSLRSGGTKSCGCLQAESCLTSSITHGGRKTRLYRIWKLMRGRCNSKTNQDYHHYGGRGIKICRKWESFSAFREWAIANGYTDSLSIERKKVNRGYSPSNCEWIPLRDQPLNTRRTRRFNAFGESKTMRQWLADARCVVGRAALQWRLYESSMTIEESLTTPKKTKAATDG